MSDLDTALANAFSQQKDESLDSVLANAFSNVEPEAPSTPTKPEGAAETVGMGLQAGVQGMLGTASSFSGLVKELTGDSRGAARDFRAGQRYSEQAAGAVSGIPTFEEAWDEGTASSIGQQLLKFTGEGIPTLATSFLGYGGGFIAGLGLKGVTKSAGERILKDAVENTLKDIATPEEKALVKNIYDAVRTDAAVKFAGNTALAGAAATEFPLLAGANIQEELEINPNISPEQIGRSLFLATLQTPVGVFADKVIFDSFGRQLKKVADSRSNNDQSIYGRLSSALAQGTARGAVAEGAAEATQESISAANRLQLDDEYNVEQALMRVGQAAFAGATIGGVAGGGFNTAGQVFGEARKLLQDGFDQKVARQADSEEFGDLDSGMSTPEARKTVDAQLDAMFDNTSSKQAVWVEGNTPFENASESIKQVEINGQTVFTAFVPGRGTIVSPNADVVQQVIQEEGSDEVLSSVLGFSSTRPDDADRVVQVTDAKGRVVSEEATNRAGQAMALRAGDRLMPEGGDVRLISPQEALRTRKESLQVNEMRLSDEDVSDPNEQTSSTESQDRETAFQTTEFEPERIEQTNYSSRADATTLYDGTEEIRQRFEEEFGDQFDIDWATDYWGRMSDGLLRKAIEVRQRGLEVDFKYQSQGDPSRPTPYHTLNVYNYGESFTTQRAGKTVRVPLDEFLAIEVARARDSQMARDNAVTIEKDGKVSRTNLVDLMNAGRRINQTREGASFDEGRAGYVNGLTTIIGELATNGYRLQVKTRNGNSVDLNTVLDDLVRQSTLDAKFARENPEQVANGQFPPRLPSIARIERVVVGRNASGRDITIGTLLRPRSTASGATTALQNDDEVVRTRVEVPPDRRVSRVGPKTLEQQKVVRTLFDFDKGQNEVVDEIPQPLPYEDEVGFDGRSETERMAENNSPDVEPVAMPGIDGPAKYPPPNTTAKKRRAVLQATYPFGGFDNTEVNTLLSSTLRFLGLTQPTVIIPYSQMQNLSRAEFESRISVPRLYDYIQAQVFLLDGALAAYVKSPDGTHVVWVNDTRAQVNANPLSLVMAVAHELGHAFYYEELDNLKSKPSVMRSLMAAYLREVKKNPELKDYYDSNYEPSKRFGEWFADQMARAARNEFKNPKNFAERIFRDLIQKLKRYWRQVNRGLKIRLGLEVDPTFQEYLDGVLAARRRSSGIRMDERAAVYAKNIQVELMKLPGAEGRAEVWRSKLRSAVSQYKGMFSIVLTADGQLRSISSKLADMFYVPAQATGRGGKIGFLRSYYGQFRQFKNDFEKAVGNLNDPEVQQAVIDAAVDGPIDPANTKAQAVRDFLAKVHRDYIEPSQTGYAAEDKIGFQENYFPVMLDLMAVADNPDAFVDLIVQQDPNSDREQVKKAVERIVKYQKAVLTGQEIEVNEFEPAEGRVEARTLTANVDKQVLAQAGFLKDPDVALTTYLRQIAKRVEWNKATKDESGNSQLKTILDGLNVQDREVAEKIIATYLGHQSEPVAPWLRQLNSWGQFLQFVTILPFSAIASIPELAGPVLNSKEFGGFKMAFQEMRRQFADRQAAARFARDIGVVADESMAGAWVSEAELDFMDPVVRNWSDKFFKAIGLDFFTRFSREFASGMSLRFLHEHAFNPMERSERYLADLGVTADDVKTFFNSGQKLDTPEGQRVKQAARKFVESSILRPNAAERPIWASDPRYALLWQLKGYLYSFYKVIIQGTQREAQTRVAEGASVPAVAAVYALAAVPFMALAMASMEAREWAKTGLSQILPFADEDKDYFRSDRMEWGDYLFESLDRSGFLGPWTIGAMMHQNAEWNRSPLIPLLGPTAETIDTVLRDGWKSVPNRLVPIYNQL